MSRTEYVPIVCPNVVLAERCFLWTDLFAVMIALILGAATWNPKSQSHSSDILLTSLPLTTISTVV